MTWLSKRVQCHDCGSSDGLALKTDGSGFCHACGDDDAYKTAERVVEMGFESMNGVPATKPTKKAQTFTVQSRVPRSFPDRGIIGAAAERFKLGFNGDDVVFPYTDENGKEVAWKVRKGGEKEFVSYGAMSEAVLFGQSLWPKAGRNVMIVEGEFDALAAWQMCGDYPVVSIKNGVGGAVKDCKASYDWLNSFENIIICFDSDEPGQAAARKVAELFMGKSRIYKHADSMKDACDYSAAHKGEAFKKRFWQAEEYMPEGIIAADTLWDEVNVEAPPPDFKYPWEGLNDITYGCRYRELVLCAAGSGLGKSQFMRELCYHFLQNTDVNIGMLFLEEHYVRTAQSIMSIAAEKPLHLPTTKSTEAERKAAYDATIGTGRVYMLDSFGSNSVDNIVSRVKYMAKAKDCKIIILDHVSIVVSGNATNDERKALDEIMTKLRTLVQETGIALFVVSHLKRLDKKSHEEGASTALAHLRGSGGLGQLSDMVIGLERNGQADDPITRNLTHVRVLKNRFSGETGRACSLLYSKETGRMMEYDMEEVL